MTREYETPGHLAARSRPDNQEAHPRWPRENEPQPDPRARPGQALEPQPAQQDGRPARTRCHDRNGSRPRARDRRPAPRQAAVDRCRRRRTQAGYRTPRGQRGRSGFPVLAHRPRRPRSRRAGPSRDRRRPAAGGRRHDRTRRRRRHRDRGDRSGRLNRRGGDRRRHTRHRRRHRRHGRRHRRHDGRHRRHDGRHRDTTVDTVDTTVDTGGTVVGTVVGTVGTVTVALSGRADASTFATKKPDTAKQTSTTSVLHLTTFISPSAECPCTQQELLAPPANLITRELEAR